MGVKFLLIFYYYENTSNYAQKNIVIQTKMHAFYLHYYKSIKNKFKKVTGTNVQSNLYYVSCFSCT